MTGMMVVVGALLLIRAGERHRVAARIREEIKAREVLGQSLRGRSNEAPRSAPSAVFGEPAGERRRSTPVEIPAGTSRPLALPSQPSTPKRQQPEHVPRPPSPDSQGKAVSVPSFSVPEGLDEPPAVHGVLLAPGSRRVRVSSPGGEGVWLQEGDVHAGWEIVDIERTHVLLQRSPRPRCHRFQFDDGDR